MKLNGITLTKEQERDWKFAKSLENDRKKSATKDKKKFKQSITCLICDELIGFSEYNDIEAICRSCAE